MFKQISAVLIGAVALISLFVIGGSFYTVDQGEEHIILRNIEELQAKNKEHRIEADLSIKVAKNIRELIGE